MLSLEGNVDVRCTLEQAWDLFCRFGEVAALIPTVTEVDIDGDRVYARVATKLGILSVSSRVNLEVVEREPLKFIRAEGVSYLGETIRDQISPKKAIQGIEKDSVGTMNMRLDLEPKDGLIAVSYHADVEAQGRLKKIYKTILKTKAPKMMEDFANNLRDRLEREDEEPAVEVEPATPEDNVEAAPAAEPGPAAEPQPKPGMWRRIADFFRRLFRRRTEEAT